MHFYHLLKNKKKTIILSKNRLKRKLLFVYPRFLQKYEWMKFSIKDFFGKCDQIHKKSLMENFIFCPVNPTCPLKLMLIRHISL